jgi:nucleotide-binding universal stress UspA family protein
VSASRPRIVVGVDGSDASRRALAWAIDEATRWHAQLDVVHAWDVPFVIVPPPVSLTYDVDRHAAERAAERVLDTCLENARVPADSTVQIERILVRDRASSALLEVAKGADLLVVGSRGHGGFAGLLLGSVSSQCIHHAICPVVVVR